MKECYYNLAQEFEEKGSYDKALLNYKLAQNKLDAYKKACGLEKKFIKKSLPGTIVRYGENEWILLDKVGSQALLLENGTGIKSVLMKREIIYGMNQHCVNGLIQTILTSSVKKKGLQW